MTKDKVFWVDIKHNKLTREQVSDVYLKNIIAFVCSGNGYYDEMSEDLIRGLFREAKRRKLDITGYTLKQALDEYKAGTTTKYKLLTPNYDFPDYGDNLNPAIIAKNIGKAQEKALTIAVVGLAREEFMVEFNAKRLNNKTAAYTDGHNTYILVDCPERVWGRSFDKIYDFRPLKDRFTMDLFARLSKPIEGYYIGNEKFEIKVVAKDKEN